MLKKLIILSILVLGYTSVEAQYTETINSNRPGESQGAYAVGKRVLQLEGGAYYGTDSHSLYRSDTDIIGGQYNLRYGFLTEILEINLIGSYQSQTATYEIGNSSSEYKISNFKTNTLGAKFLVYDPYKKAGEEKPNLISWKANQKFKWKRLIPAISVYAGANFSFGDNPYLYEGESKLSPKAAVITQNNWGRWVLVINIIADKFTEEFPTYASIVTLTHAINPEFAIFGEYQGYMSDIYADDVLRGGAAYLLTDDFQVDLSGLVNFKNTPSRWQVAVGVSYRFDFHEEDEYVEDKFKGSRKKKAKQERKDADFLEEEE